MKTHKQKNQNKKRKINSYDICDMEKAIESVKDGTSLRSASKLFKVPFSTLQSRIKGTYPIDVKKGPNSVLSREEEKKIVNWIEHANKCGFPIKKKHLLDTVQYIVKKTNRRTPFINGRPSRKWYYSFLIRNPEFSEKMCQNISRIRACSTEESLIIWFMEIKSYLESKNLFNIGAERVFNLVETAFLLNPKGSKVLVRKREKSLYSVCGKDKKCYAALIVGNAAGQLLPSMITYDNESIPHLVAKHFPSGFVIGKSSTGWMASGTFYVYITNVFYPWCLKNKIEFPIVLYVDKGSVHLTLALSEFCCNHGIELIALYPNCTYSMQPIDVAIYNPLKVAYKDAIQNWRMKNNGRFLTKPHLASVIKTALYSLDLKNILQSGFEYCGLYPFSENTINYSKLIKKINKLEQEVTVEQQSYEENFDPAMLEGISFIESNIEPAVLQEFKNHSDSSEWCPSIEYKELYHVWLSCKKQVSSTSDSSTKIVSEDQNKSVEECSIENPNGNMIVDETGMNDLISVDDEDISALIDDLIKNNVYLVDIMSEESNIINVNTYVSNESVMDKLTLCNNSIYNNNTQIKNNMNKILLKMDELNSNLNVSNFK